MEKEEVNRLLDIATKSRVHGALIGALLLAVGIIFVTLGAHAIVLEITVTGILMIVFGIRAVMKQGIKSTEGIPMILLGALFVVLVYIFEVLHGLILFLEFLSTGVVYLAAALGYRESKRSRRTSLAISIISIYVAVNLIVAHEESMDILITIMGAFLVVLSIYVLWCAVMDRPVVNPLTKDEE